MTSKKKNYELKEGDIKIGTPNERIWTTIRDKCKEAIKNCTDEIMVQKEFLAVAEKKIVEEQEKLK